MDRPRDGRDAGKSLRPGDITPVFFNAGQFYSQATPTNGLMATKCAGSGPKATSPLGISLRRTAGISKVEDYLRIKLAYANELEKAYVA